MTVRSVDVAIIGDGPAGSALARSCHGRGADVVLVGPDEPWPATYAAWVDDLPVDLADVAGDLFASVSDQVRVGATSEHLLDRAYGVFDNDSLRHVLRCGPDHVVDRVAAVSPMGEQGRTVTTTSGAELRARLVVDATGWPPSFASSASSPARAWQTAFGVVLGEPPPGTLGRPTLMDFSPPPVASRSASPAADLTTFCYSVPVGDGWLVEETILASTTPITPGDLLPRLAARLDCTPEDLLDQAIRTETVRIPMGGALPDRRESVVTFGASSGYVHPATGFSVAASLRAAPRVADAIVEDGATPRSIQEAIWPPAQRRTRVLQDYGLDTLLRLDADEVAAFFDGFFDLPRARWSAYLRVDAAPTEVAAAMTSIFRSTTWQMRRRLMTGNPTPLVRLLRP